MPKWSTAVRCAIVHGSTREYTTDVRDAVDVTSQELGVMMHSSSRSWGMEMGEPEVGCRLSYLNKTVSNGGKKEKNLPFTLGWWAFRQRRNTLDKVKAWWLPVGTVLNWEGWVDRVTVEPRAWLLAVVWLMTRACSAMPSLNHKYFIRNLR